MPEKVPDYLHGHALIQQMLGHGMAQGMCAASARDDAYSCETITDDLAKGLSANRLDGRVRCKEEAAPVAGRTAFPYVAQNGIADVR